MKDTAPIQEGNDFEVYFPTYLRIRSVTPDNAGMYTCAAHNPNISVTSHGFKLNTEPRQGEHLVAHVRIQEYI